MSFITKRERVFNEYELFDLPSRNEGKLKAYASCTDARAWSHFCSDKSEHLTDIIKRNNEMCRTKYIPTTVIVDTIMVSKNAEISRLRRKIEEFGQMLAAYDELDLTCEQKCEIANAHAAIKAANKELDDMCLDLDFSGFTEGIDSEAFETGKSRGDELGVGAPYKPIEVDKQGLEGNVVVTKPSSRQKTESKSNQTEKCTCDVTTTVHDSRIQNMKDTIINKDAKLSAMQNTIAVMENDVCEPYCIYANIYTALEKIFGILCQNDKYKCYLTLLTAGRDTRCIDIKGRILFKVKVLEKFCLALIAPCSQDLKETSHRDCSCFRAEIDTRLESLTLSNTEFNKPNLDNKRAHLVAEIIDSEEIREFLNKESTSVQMDDQENDRCIIDDYNIDTENLSRLKSLQINYDDLMNCYESLKNEKEFLQIRLHKYEEQYNELENLRGHLREYNLLWTEMEHYKKRSLDVDTLKEQFMVLSEETMNLETRLKAEIEINHAKSVTIEELRANNVELEKRNNNAYIACEKEKNYLQCKLKETECKIMCQEQQIKCLTIQIDELLEKTQVKENDAVPHPIALIDELDTKSQEINSLKDTLFGIEEEKLNLQDKFHENVKLTNALKLEIEDWKSAYNKTLQKCNCLEQYLQNYQSEVNKLQEENSKLTSDVKKKSVAVENLMDVISKKSEEVNRLMDESADKSSENKQLLKQISQITNENQQVVNSLQVSRQESKELLQKIKSFDEISNEHKNNNQNLRGLLKCSADENKKLKLELDITENSKNIFIKEFQTLQNLHKEVESSLTNLKEENIECKKSFEIIQKESKISLDNLSLQILNLEKSKEQLLNEKKSLELELLNKNEKLENVIYSLELSKKESKEILQGEVSKSENTKAEFIKLNKAYQQLLTENKTFQKTLLEKSRDLESNQQTINYYKEENNKLLENLSVLKKHYDDLLHDKNVLQNYFDNKCKEFDNLYSTLENKIDENRDLTNKVKMFENNEKDTTNNLEKLQQEHSKTQNTLENINRESSVLLNKLKNYETLEEEYSALKNAHESMLLDKQRLQNELTCQLRELNRFKTENTNLLSQSSHMLEYSEHLEKSLVDSREKLIDKSESPLDLYANVMKEIDNFKKEKVLNRDKIRELLDQKEELENMISSLTEDLFTRNDKISIMENHINELEYEVKRLQDCLMDAVDTSVQLKDISFYKIDQSLQAVEAHHSKATHNIKLEMAKLQKENNILEKKLSNNKIKTEESYKDKHKYLSQISHLQNEREIIVTEIKQLELDNVGESSLKPNNCDLENILMSLDRLRRYFNSKTNSLEQTLLEVQKSSQLLSSKAEEAKTIAENEKLKIINEKEDAIKDRINLEKQLSEIKERSEKQIAYDKTIIKDLEAEISNQSLLFEEINKSTKNYILKLEEDLKSLQELYEISIMKSAELQDKLNTISEENVFNRDKIEKVNTQLRLKCKEIDDVQKELEAIKNKIICNIGTQASLAPDFKDISTQIEENYVLKLNINDGEKLSHKNSDAILLNSKQTNNIWELLPSQRPHPINEVQILTANIEPTFDFVRNSYLNYKLKRLDLGKLVQYSISNKELKQDIAHTDSKCQNVSETDNKILIHDNLIDIYNRHSLSLNTISSRLMESFDGSPVKGESPTKSSAVTGFGLTIDSFNTDSNVKTINILSESQSENSEGKDVFLIYNDSENRSDEPKPKYQNRPELTTNLSMAEKDNQNHNSENNHVNFANFGDECGKTKLEITLPRIDIASQSLITTSDGNDTSVDVNGVPILHSTKRKLMLSDTVKDKNNKIPLMQNNSSLSMVFIEENYHLKCSTTENTISDEETKKDILLKHNLEKKPVNHEVNSQYSGYKSFEKILRGKENSNETIIKHKTEPIDSHHKLARVDADVFLIKNKKDYTDNINKNLKHKFKENTNDFGLQYILNTMQQEVGVGKLNHLNNIKPLRASKSDQRFYHSKYKEASDRSPSIVTSLKTSPYDRKSSPHTFDSISQTPSKLLVDRSVLVDNITIQNYENKILTLTRALESLEKDYKKKLNAIKMQYDSNIKCIINDHNEGVKSIQGLHEETVQDLLKRHENEVENLRTMSIEAMKKVGKLERENKSLKNLIQCSDIDIIEEAMQSNTNETKKRKNKLRGDTKMLSKTNVEAFDVKPKKKSHGPCTCSLGINASDTIRNIFEQVDTEQRRLAEHAYLKYIANKILCSNVENLDAQELSFLHLKVCKIWKMKLNKEEALQKRIDSLESELLNKQRHAQQHIAELDRKVVEERKRLQEVREAVGRSAPVEEDTAFNEDFSIPALPPSNLEHIRCNCVTDVNCFIVGERRSAGDLVLGSNTRTKRNRKENNRAVIAKLDVDERRDKKIYCDEFPTRLRRPHDRATAAPRPNKKS